MAETQTLTDVRAKEVAIAKWLGYQVQYHALHPLLGGRSGYVLVYPEGDWRGHILTEEAAPELENATWNDRPRFSEDPASFVTLLEALAAKGWSPYGGHSKTLNLWYSEMASDEEHYYGVGETPPLALLEAAYKLVEQGASEQ